MHYIIAQLYYCLVSHISQPNIIDEIAFHMVTYFKWLNFLLLMDLSNMFTTKIALSSVITINGRSIIAKISQHLIPQLTPQSYKGQMGRIGVIGGSSEYTGAPYYAGESALKFGADLLFIFCASQAAIPIKCYSPELMVSPFYDTEAFSSSEGLFIPEEREVVHFTVSFNSSIL